MVLNLVMGDMIFEEYSYEEEDYIANLENPGIYYLFNNNNRSIRRSRNNGTLKGNREWSSKSTREDILRLTTHRRNEPHVIVVNVVDGNVGDAPITRNDDASSLNSI